MRKQFLVACFFLAFIFQARGQKKLTISGYVQDTWSEEKMIGVSIWSPGIKGGTTTNNYGYFSVTFLRDTATVLFSAIGYKPAQVFFSVNNSDSILIIKLEKENTDLGNVIVNASKPRPIEQRTLLGQVSIPVDQIKSLPRFLGESDVLKTLQLLPGVQQGSEGTSGILVRGGSPDQNLILLDGTPVYNTQHLFGIFSTFNTAAIKNVELYKGGFPARFGGRLSSVVDIVTKDGNMNSYHGEASIALIMSRLSYEGPLKKNKTSFFISGRRSYLDVLAKPFVKSAARRDGTDLDFNAFLYDLNVKLNHIFSKTDRLFFSFFSGRDLLKFNVKDTYNNTTNEERIKIGYGNLISTIRWNHIFNKQLFSNTIINYTNYRFLTEASQKETGTNFSNSFASKYYSGIYDIGANINFDYRPNPQNAFKFGTAIIAHSFTPGAATLKSTDNNIVQIDTSFNTKNQHSIEGNIYVEDDWEISDKLKANIGLHASFFKATTKTFPSVQPRMGIRYLLPNNWAIKAGYTQMAQFIHLLTNSTTTLPTDLWVPSTDKVKPMKSEQFALGIAKTIWNGNFEASVEAYTKTMDGVIEYKDGASYLNSSIDNWDTKVEQGSGKSRGVELLLQKKQGRTTGWIGYTLSKTDRQFTNINFGKSFPYKYDRRHDFELVLIHKINTKWEISGSWSYSTANSISLPLANYSTTSIFSPYQSFSSGTVEYYNGRNGFRLLNYHRLDFSISKTRVKKNTTRIWDLSFYNMYNRKNPFYYYLSYDNPTRAGRVKSVTLLPIIPNLSLTVKF